MSEHLTSLYATTGEPVADLQSEDNSKTLGFGLGLLALGAVSLVLGMFISLIFFATVLCFVAGLNLLYSTFRMRGLRVLVCPNALIRVRRGSAEVLPWDQVGEVRRAPDPEIFLGAPLPTAAPPLVLVSKSGRKWPFYHALAGFDELVAEVERRSLPPLMASALETLNAGGRVKFGKLEVSEKGLHIGPDTLRWKHFSHSEWEDQVLLIHEEGEEEPFLRRQITYLPNCHLLMALCNRYR